MTFWLKFAVVLVLMTALDAVWALYVKFTGAHRAMPAAISAVLIYAMGSTVTLQWISDWRLIPPALVGSFVGTFAVVKWGNK